MAFSISDLNPNTPSKPAPSQKSYSPPSRQTTGAIQSAIRQDPRKDKVPPKGPAAASGKTVYRF